MKGADRTSLLDDAYAMSSYPGVGWPNPNESVRILRHIYAWLPALDDAKFWVPKLETWEIDTDGTAWNYYQDLVHSLLGQLRNASHEQLVKYRNWYSRQWALRTRPLRGKEATFIEEHFAPRRISAEDIFVNIPKERRKDFR